MTDQSQTNQRRGIYLLPNLLTTAGLFAGFYAILAAMGGRFEAAAIAVFAAMVMDGIDGRVARLTHTQSQFGAEYDSLADMVSFGVAPALVAYEWTLHGLGKLGWFAAFVYAAATALRLARFNSQADKVDKRYFQGLASPTAAALVAGLVWLGVDTGLAAESLRVPAFLVVTLSGVLMFSNIRYHSFKDLDLKGKVPFITAVAVMLGFAVVIVQPPVVLFTVALAYACSGPLLTLIKLRRTRHARRRDEADSPEDTPPPGDSQ
jgi:CDP-diacylglycerol--serine O-phosphatidyltransferase